jgi:hypothetical protein
MTEEMRSRLLGMILGRVSRGQFPQREPVAFLYNGVRLPGLPVVDGLPNVYFAKRTIMGITGYCAYFTSEPYYAFASTGEYCIGRRIGDCYYIVKEGDTEWAYQSTWENEGVIEPVATVFWANFDIFNEDGSVALAASNPVPVYE